MSEDKELKTEWLTQHIKHEAERMKKQIDCLKNYQRKLDKLIAKDPNYKPTPLIIPVKVKKDE